MADILEALKFRWDAPYRLLASVLGIAGIIAALGPWKSSGPVELLGTFGGWLNIHDAPRFAGDISTWLTSHQPVVGIVAFLLFMAALVVNKNRRAASTAVLSLAVIHEVAPGTLSGYWTLFGVLLFLLIVGVVLGKMGVAFVVPATSWLSYSALHLIEAFIYALAIPFWLLASSSPNNSQN